MIKDPFTKLLALLNYYTFNEKDTKLYKEIKENFEKGLYSNMDQYNLYYVLLQKLHNKY